MSNKEKIKVEIERLKGWVNAPFVTNEKVNCVDILNNLLSFVDSLPEEYENYDVIDAEIQSAGCFIPFINTNNKLSNDLKFGDKIK